MPDRTHPHRLSPEDYRTPGRVTFLTICTKGRRSLLGDDEACQAVVAALRQWLGADGLHLVAFCVMPNHVHVVVATVTSTPLDQRVARFKGRSSHDLHGIGITGPVWERSYWDRAARRDDDVVAMVEYVLANPVRKGLCEEAEAWPHLEFCGWPQDWQW